MRKLLLVFAIYLFGVGISNAQTIPSANLAILSQQYNLVYTSPNLYFNLTLANPPTDVNGNLPQSVRLTLIVKYPNQAAVKDVTMIASNLWNNDVIWTPWLHSTTQNADTITSNALPMYNNTLASANFLTSIPTIGLCNGDTIWYQLQARYYSDTAGTVLMTWQQNGSTDSIAISQQVGVTKLVAVNLPSLITGSYTCRGDSICLGMLDVQHFAGAFIDSAKISVVAPLGTTLLGFKVNGNTVSTALSHTFAGQFNNISYCAYFPNTFPIGNTQFLFTYITYACGQIDTHLVTYDCLVKNCKKKCNCDPAYKCLAAAVCLESDKYEFTRTDTTSFGFHDLVMTMPIQMNATDLSIPATLFGASYTVTPVSTNCSSLSGIFASTSLSLSSMYNCGPTEIEIKVRVTDIIKNYNYIFFIASTYDSGIVQGTQAQYKTAIFDSSGNIIAIDTVLHYTFWCYQNAFNRFIVGTDINITTVIANPGAVVPCIFRLTANGLPSWLQSLEYRRIAIEAPSNWTFEVAAGVGEKKLPQPDQHLALQTHPFGSFSSYFVQQGTLLQPYTTSTTNNWLYIDSIYPASICGGQVVWHSGFYYSIRVLFGTPPGIYNLKAYVHSSDGAIQSYLQDIQVIVAINAQIYASTKSKCFDNTFYSERNIINDTSTGLQFMGELINTGNVPLTNLSLFNSEPKLANGTMQDIQHSECSYAIRGSDFDCINYGLNATSPVSISPVWTNAANYTHLNPANLDTIPFGNVTPIGATNFSLSCAGAASATGGLANGSIMLNAASNFTLQPLDRISFYTNKMAHNGSPGDTVFNTFSYVATRTDFGTHLPIVTSTKCTTAVVASGMAACPACEYVTLSFGCKNDPTLTVQNLSGVDVSKIELAFTGPCIVGTYTISYTLYNLLAPGQSVVIPDHLLPNFAPGCSVSVSTTLYSQTITGTNQFLDNCTSGILVAATVPDTLAQIVQFPPIVCYGQSTTLTVNGIGTSAPYLYSFNAGAFDSTHIFSNITPSSYTTVVQDSFGCRDTVITIVTQPDSLFIASLTHQDVLCHGDSTGKVQISITGGLPLFNTIIQPGSFNIGNATSFTTLPLGSYTILVTDALGCTTSDSFSIAEPTALQHTLSSTIVTCAGGNDGSICDTATGGVAPYTYALNSGLFTSAQCFTMLTNASYTVTAKDANNCTISSTLALPSIAPPLTFNGFAVRPPTCTHDSSGEIKMYVQGGTQLNTAVHYTYNINANNSSYVVTATADSLLLTNIKAGYYTIVAVDANGCSTSTEVDLPYVGVFGFYGISSTPATCNGTNTGTVYVTTTGGYAPYSFSLQGIANNLDSGYFQGVAAGLYTVTITDSLGCALDSVVRVEQQSPLLFSQLDIQSVTCEGYTNGAIISAALGGVATYTFQLLPLGATNTTGDFSNLSTGTYTLIVTDKNACTKDTAITIGLTATPLQLSTQAIHISSCTGPGSYGSAIVQFMGTGNAPISVSWSTEPVQYDSVAINLSEGTYTAVATDAKGCAATTTVQILDSLNCCGIAILPNAFTPNDDLLNDEFGVMNSSELNLDLESFEVFDRWGNRVFSTAIYGEKWNGKIMGENAEGGMYFYYYKYTCLEDGKRYLIQGDVWLAR
ncbi:MAG: hypothetical protein RL660_2671 [Bacteroidota bacterium]|jgi:gliding motility-associated-like protein